jgi:UDP-GlcNAc:undecaprenyl-phosphate GlcNAc-1-phosphate transferase
LFLGDAGSHALGYCLAMLTLTLLPEAGALGLLAPVALPLLDLVQVIVLRLLAGRAPWRADHRHLAHHLRAAGLPAAALAPVLALVAALLVWPL